MPARAGLAAVCLAILFAGSAGADEPPVSFSREIAPVLVGQCLACHNDRSAKGRFSVESFADVIKGGEAGPAVTPGDAALSGLVLQVESGEMPKDGDPLPAAQVAALKRWIAAGAKLDEGKSADALLTSLIPKPVQPTPPEVYPAAVPVTALAFSPDGGLLAVSGYHEVLLFSAADGRLVRRVQNVAERVHSVSFSPDGRTVAVAAGTPGRLGDLKLFRVEDGGIVADLLTAADSVLSVAFSPDGTKLAAGGADRVVRVWNLADRGEPLRIEDHADWVTAVAFGPGGDRLATASRDKTAKVFDLGTQETLATFTGHDGPVLDVLFAPGGNAVVSCGADKQVRLWNIGDAKQTKNLGTGGELFSLAAAGSDAFACGGADRTVRVVGYDGSLRKTFDPMPDWVYAVAASPDGSVVAAGAYDGTITLRTRDGDLVRSFAAMPPKE